MGYANRGIEYISRRLEIDQFSIFEKTKNSWRSAFSKRIIKNMVSILKDFLLKNEYAPLNDLERIVFSENIPRFW